MKPSRYAKAIVGALLAGMGSLQVALVDGVVTGNEILVAAMATVAALGLVWGVPNAAEAKDEPVRMNSERRTYE